MHKCEYTVTKEWPCHGPGECVVQYCGVCGVGRIRERCVEHAFPPAVDPAQHYLKDLCGHKENGIPRHMEVAQELRNAMWEMGRIFSNRIDNPMVLDVGAGIGPYAPLFMSLGYQYEAVEVNEFAKEYLLLCHNARVHESIPVATGRYDLVLSAHSLEHLRDAKQALEDMIKVLKPGGWLILLLPEGTDLGNPEHEWFFDEAGLTFWLKEFSKLTEIRTITRRVTDKERYVYAQALRG